MLLERAMAWNTQILMGRQAGVLAVDKEAEPPKDPAHPQSCAATYLPQWTPLGSNLIGLHWQLSSLHPLFTYRAACLWLPQSQSTPQLSPMSTLGSWPLFHEHH